MNLFYAVIVGFVFLCFSEYIVPEFSLQSQHYSLYKHLKWINDSRNKCRFHPLSYYVIERSKGINSLYALQDNDYKEYVPEILNYFVEDINKLYFQNEISLNTKVLHLEDEDYFLYRLFIFLDCHFEEPSFNGCRLYYIAEHIHYDDLGYELCDYTRSLTDFGIIYAKLLYAAYTACLSNKKLASMVQDNGWCEYLEKTIKNKE